MTEEYKNNLLRYFTDNIRTEDGVNEPQLIVNSNIKNDFGDFLKNNISNIKTKEYSDMEYVSFSILGCLQANNSSKMLVYGNYDKTGDDSNSYGAIVIIDDKLNPVSAITKFDSGTEFREFIMLNIDEENYIYGVDTNTDSNTNEYRFIMLNKIIGSGDKNNNYQAILRQSYYFPTVYNSIYFPTYYFDGTNRLLKKPNGAEYLFIGYDDSIKIIKLTVNVGEANEWVDYTSGSGLGLGFVATYLNWTGEKPVLRVGGHNSNINGYQEVKLENDVLNIVISSPMRAHIRSVAFKNNEETYIGANTNDVVQIYKINYSQNKLESIYSLPVETYEMGSQIHLSLKNGQVMVEVAVEKETRLFEFKLGLIYNDSVYVEDIGQFKQYGGSYDIPVIFSKNDFNLWRIIKMVGNYYSEVVFIFNPNNYNGLSFNNKESLLPNSGVLYDDENSPIFARNLYNKTIQDNTTQSSIQVPNTYLNDVDIAKKDLLSKNNNIMVSDKNILKKNIYETILINYFNTLQIKNDNDKTRPKLNFLGAVRLNKSVSDLVDYEDAKMNKYRINYADDTTLIQNCTWYPVSNFYRTDIAFYVDKEISSIDFISNDEVTVYQTIDNQNFTIGKFYRLSQDVYINEKE